MATNRNMKYRFFARNEDGEWFAVNTKEYGGGTVQVVIEGDGSGHGNHTFAEAVSRTRIPREVLVEAFKNPAPGEEAPKKAHKKHKKEEE